MLGRWRRVAEAAGGRIDGRVDHPAARKRVLAHGDVQGVFFRDSVRARARDSGVAGWVANRPDGAVEAVFEGDGDAVERLVDFCRSGPPAASVERVDESQEEPEGLSGFEVR